MKIKLFTSALFNLLLSGSLAVNAQSWSLTGNAGTSLGTHFIGTTDEEGLEFRTNNKTWMVIYPDGNIDINSNDINYPAYLTVTGGIGMSGGKFILDHDGLIRFNNPTVTAEAMIYMFHSGTNNFDRMVLGHSYYYPKWGLEYQDNGDKFHFRTDGNRRVTIDLLNGRVGIGNESPFYQLNLSLNSAAKPTSSAWTVPSDQRLKKDVIDFTDGLKIIQQIHPVWFSYTGEAGMPAGERGVGTLAQELQKVAPYMVNEWTYTDEASGKETNYLDVDYHALLFMFINAFKEQEQSIQELQSELKSIKTQTAGSKTEESKEGVYSPSTDNEGGLLGQNIPNPFDNSTLIPFRIPKDCKDATIMISESATGKIARVIPVACGETQLTLEAGLLPGGNYSYSLIIDGRIISTKGMIIQK